MYSKPWMMNQRIVLSLPVCHRSSGIGISNWTVILTILFIGDTVVIACCIPFLIQGKGL